ncbi:hypothetical protein ASG52_08355 [Methylobacterium sp. Leaf456]|uniref:hypothetical protein n=1 Tax=Methylobacterium sp. Leaf456 TaxID=1736382 RepID=UPI000700E9CF|nr:hypothetical protein [Methylobacterium sp. Leaf456]KQT50157.1 hypothetical protein ASG52_08355 [Methylobacterium sp. Leaf456]
MSEQPEPLADGDLLVGMAAIARHLGITERQGWHLKDACDLPTFKQGRTVCARKSTLAQHFAAREAAARNRPPV